MALAINGTPVSGSISGATSNTSPSFTSTVTNTWVIAVSVAEQATTNPVINAGGVTATGLTFTKRKALVFTTAGGVHVSIEVWYALASATFSGTVKAQYGGTFDDSSIIVFAVSGADLTTPWDPSSTSTTATHDTGAAAPTVSGALSTSNANTMLLGFCGAGNSAGAVTQTAGAIAGTTGTLGKTEIFNGGANSSSAAFEYRIVSATQSSVAVAFGQTDTQWVMIADAIQAPASISTSIGWVPQNGILVPNKGPSRGLRAIQAFPTSSVVDTLLTAAFGSFTETGEAATFDMQMPGAFGSFAETGEAAALGPGIVAAFGSFAETGEPVIFDMKAPGAVGSFTETGEAATFDILVSAAFAAFVETGEPALFDVGMPGAFGGYVLTGEPANLSSPGSVTADFGSFLFTGEDATLAASSSAGELPHNLRFLCDVGSLMCR